MMKIIKILLLHKIQPHFKYSQKKVFSIEILMKNLKAFKNFKLLKQTIKELQ